MAEGCLDLSGGQSEIHLCLFKLEWSDKMRVEECEFAEQCSEQCGKTITLPLNDSVVIFWK